MQRWGWYVNCFDSCCYDIIKLKWPFLRGCCVCYAFVKFIEKTAFSPGHQTIALHNIRIPDFRKARLSHFTIDPFGWTSPKADEVPETPIDRSLAITGEC